MKQIIKLYEYIIVYAYLRVSYSFPIKIIAIINAFNRKINFITSFRSHCICNISIVLEKYIFNPIILLHSLSHCLLSFLK